MKFYEKLKLFFKKLGKDTGLILLYFILQLIGPIVIEVYKIQNNTIVSIIYILDSLITFLIIAFLLRENLKDQLNDFKKNYKEYLPKSFKYWAIGFTFMFISNIVVIMYFLKGISPNEEANRLMIEQYPIYAGLSVCLFAPLTEELLFRLNFKNLFKRRLPFVLFTGILFGSMHVVLSLTSINDLLYIIPYSALGIAFGFIYYDTDNIYSSISMHAFHNTLTFIMILSEL